AQDALATARSLGDPDTLLYVLHNVRSGAAYVMTAEQRFEVSREIAELAEAQGQPLLRMRVGPEYAAALLERGLRADADARIEKLAELYAAHGSGAPRWRLPMLRAAFALFDGDVDGSERRVDEAIAMAAHAGTTPAPVLWAQHRVAAAVACGDPR